MIQRGVKSKIAQRDRAPKRDTEGLDRAIEVLVIDRVLIMVEAGDWPRHLVGNEGTAIDSRFGLDRMDGCARPGSDGSGHPHRGSSLVKGETRRAPLTVN